MLFRSGVRIVSGSLVRVREGRFCHFTEFQLPAGQAQKFEIHVWLVALYTVYYNWIKIHKTTLRVTPAMQAGLSNHVCTFGDLAELIEANQGKPGPRGPDKKGAS